MERNADRAAADPGLATCLDRLFREARTFSHWQSRDVPDSLLRQAWNLARLGPTSANCQPMRLVLVRSEAGKAKLEPALSPGNVEKTMAAPVTAILAMDMAFYEHLPRLFHDPTARSWFAGKAAVIRETALRNATLQAAYYLLACRALGLDCGPMSGFDAEALDAAFFAGSTWRANFLMNIGYGERSSLHPRDPRLDFAEACRFE